jgi:Icc-related predicted phosphoesterase
LFPVKILAVSDEVVDHIYSSQIRDNYCGVDLVLGCGDLPYFYLEYIVTMLDVPLLYVHGNHDRHEQYMSDGRIIHRAEGCIDIDGRVKRSAGLLLAGLGGSIRYRPDEKHMYTEMEMAGRATAMAPHLAANRLRWGRFLDVLVTHSPPRGIHDGPDFAHTGFKTFCVMMERFKPRLLLHGHAHVYRRDLPAETVFCDTRVINIYPYKVIELGIV